MKKIILLLTLTALLLPGCGCASTEETFAPISATTDATETKKDSNNGSLEDLAIDPPYSFDVDSMNPSDFGAFKTTYYQEVSTYTIGDGTEAASHTVTVLEGDKSGKTVYIIAGIHGDEEAAWQAGKLLKKASIKAGTVYIVAPASELGAKQKSRKIEGNDPNRCWPGKADGTAAERNAYYIYQDVLDKDPDFVIDLHEARVVQSDGDSLGSSILYSNLDIWPDGLFFDFMSDTQAGKVCSRPFHSDSPGKVGSINRVITEEAKIPVMTIETFRGYQMDNRISDQLAVCEYVLRYFNMVD